ncbi:hypothetical protein QOT17_002115 [Balamuthia mandrillaris]
MHCAVAWRGREGAALLSSPPMECDKRVGQVVFHTGATKGDNGCYLRGGWFHEKDHFTKNNNCKGIIIKKKEERSERGCVPCVLFTSPSLPSSVCAWRHGGEVIGVGRSSGSHDKKAIFSLCFAFPPEE